MLFNFQVLTNGIEVKLQRNALSVLEHPTGNEEDNDLEVDHTTQWNNPSDMSKFGSLSLSIYCPKSYTTDLVLSEIRKLYRE